MEGSIRCGYCPFDLSLFDVCIEYCKRGVDEKHATLTPQQIIILPHYGSVSGSNFIARKPFTNIYTSAHCGSFSSKYYIIIIIIIIIIMILFVLEVQQ